MGDVVSLSVIVGGFVSTWMFISKMNYNLARLEQKVIDIKKYLINGGVGNGRERKWKD